MNTKKIQEYVIVRRELLHDEDDQSFHSEAYFTGKIDRLGNPIFGGLYRAKVYITVNEDQTRHKEIRKKVDELQAYYYEKYEIEGGPVAEDEVPTILYMPYSGYVNVYLVDQACGGLEEGGWYYRVQEPVSFMYFTSTRQRRVLMRIAEENYPNAGRRPISSVLSEGQYEIVVEAKPAEASPQRKPHYE